MLEFVQHGFTDRLKDALPLPRHALHSSQLIFETDGESHTFEAPMAKDLERFYNSL